MTRLDHRYAIARWQAVRHHWRAAPLALRVYAAMIAVLLLAAFVRFHLLGGQSFWNDEGNAYVQATRGFTEIAANAARDIHPPGYYWLLAAWRGLAGETEFALRALSAFASLVSVACAFALGHWLFGASAGVVAALIVALNTFSIYYAQEARMYALLALWGAAGMWAFVVFVRRPGWQHGAALGLINAAGLWTHYSYPFVLLAQGVLLLVWLVADLRAGWLRRFAYTFGAYVAANLFTVALFVPWLPTAYNQITTWPSTGQPAPFAEALGVILNWLTFGIASAYTSPGALAVTNILLLFALLGAYQPARRWWRLLVPVVWVIVTVAAFLALDLYRQPNLKFLIPAQIGMALWLARGLQVVWGLHRHLRWLRPSRARLSGGARVFIFRLTAVLAGAWLAFNLAAGIGPLYTDPAYRRADYRALVADLRAELRPGDAIILDAPNQEEVFRYYYQGDFPIYTLPPGLGGDDDATRAAVNTIIDAHARAFVVFWGEAERDPNRVVETTLDRRAYEVGDVWYGDVRLARYLMPDDLPQATEADVRFGDHITLIGYALGSTLVPAGDAVQVRLVWQTDTPLDTRYKVFLQLLDDEGVLVAQRDSEPVGGLALTTTWEPGEVVDDHHGLLIPRGLPPGEYTLIAGLYDLNNPAARLPVDGGDYLRLATITVQ